MICAKNTEIGLSLLKLFKIKLVTFLDTPYGPIVCYAVTAKINKHNTNFEFIVQTYTGTSLFLKFSIDI